MLKLIKCAGCRTEVRTETDNVRRIKIWCATCQKITTHKIYTEAKRASFNGLGFPPSNDEK